MRKLVTSIFLSLFLSFFLVSSVYAADLNIDCPTIPGVCTKTGEDPLFSASDGLWYPGKSITKIVNLNNSGTESKVMSVGVTRTSPVDSILENALLVEIVPSSGPPTVFSGNLADLYSLTNIDFGTFASGTSQDFNFMITMDPNSGNETQNRQTVFDLILGFWEEASPSPSPTPTSTTSVLGAASAPVCSDTIPTSAPFLTSSATSDNTVLLTWTAISPVSHYMIRYGTSPGNYVYGAANVGNVTQYTVQGLSGGTTYYFQVAGVNGCQPGPWSNETSPVATGPTLTEFVAVGFVEQQLGLSTEAAESPSPAVESGQGEVKGLETAPCELPFPWWIPLLFQFAFTAIYLVIRKGQGSVKNVFMVPLVIAILSLIAHLILGCPCENLALIDKLCPWYPLIDLILLFLLLVLYQFFLKESRQKS